MNQKRKECVAMLLAGGQGSRLYALTKSTAKPAVTFGGKYRIIDFPLSNCINSGIDTVGVPGLDGFDRLVGLHFYQNHIGNITDHQLRQMPVIHGIPVIGHLHTAFYVFLFRITEDQHMAGQISTRA